MYDRTDRPQDANLLHEAKTLANELTGDLAADMWHAAADVAHSVGRFAFSWGGVFSRRAVAVGADSDPDADDFQLHVVDMPRVEPEVVAAMRRHPAGKAP